MKKLLIVFGLFAAACLYGQTSTVKDWGSWFVLEYDHGDTIPLYKDRVTMMPTTDGVRFYTPEWGFLSYSVKNHILSPSYHEMADFASDTSTVFQDYMRNMVMSNYTPAYGFDASSGGVDTIWYILGNAAADTAYIWVGTWSGDSLTNSKIIHP